ncbi:MAG: glycosyltransferase [Thermaurantimonas sp.]
MNNKVLIVTYYWPPSGGIAVQRWLKFSKHLLDLNWHPIIYTPENPELFYEDPTTLDEVPPGIEIVKTRIFEPYSLYQFLTGIKKKESGFGFAKENRKKSWIGELGVWIRGNVFIPDARVFWIRPSVNFLSGYLKKNPVDTLITTGPPHSMHLIGLGLKKKFDIKWIADFRDPWTNIDYYADLKLTKWADDRHYRLEKKVLDTADAVLVVSNDMKKEFESKTRTPVYLISNGFDMDDFDTAEAAPDSRFVITHVGTMPPTRNPDVLWKSLKNLCEIKEDFSRDLLIRLVGKVDASILKSIDEHGLRNHLDHIPFVPRSEALKYQKSSRINLLVVNNTPNAAGIITGKLFEYLAAGRYILGIGPEDGDMSQILRETKAGDTIGFENFEKAVSVLTDLYERFKSNTLTIQSDSIQAFSRKNIAKKISDIIHHLHVRS